MLSKRLQQKTLGNKNYCHNHYQNFYNNGTPIPTQTQWNLQLVHEKALLFNTRGKFQRAYNGAYCWAKRNSLLGFVCSHMKTLPNIADCVSVFTKYDKVSHVNKQNEAVYRWALRQGLMPLLKDYLAHD